jgi:hypothetical protein
MAGDTGKAKAPYKDFLTLLKDADATSHPISVSPPIADG